MSNDDQHRIKQQLTDSVKLFVIFGDDVKNHCQNVRIEMVKKFDQPAAPVRRVASFKLPPNQFKNVQDFAANWTPYSGIVAALLMQLDGVYQSW